MDVGDPVHHLGDIPQPHRRAVSVGDHRGREGRRREACVIGVDLEAQALVLDHPLGPGGVGRGQGGAHVLEADPVTAEGQGVELHPHRRQGAAADLHLAHALHLAQLLLDDGAGDVVDLAGRAGLRRQGEDDHRRVGGVDLVIGRVGPQGCGQVDARGVDRRLHVPRRAVDVAVEAELQHHVGLADPAARGHLGDVGNHSKMFLQRCGDAGGHGLGAGPGQAGADGDGWQIDLRQGRDRQLEEGGPAGHGQADGQQDRGDGPADEELRQVHGGAACAPAPVREFLSPRRRARRSNCR